MECLPTVTIRLQSNFNGCPITLIILKEKNHRQRVQIEPNELFYATFDSVKEVRVQCNNSPGGTCGAFGDIQVHGCVFCCESSDECSD